MLQAVQANGYTHRREQHVGAGSFVIAAVGAGSYDAMSLFRLLQPWAHWRVLPVAWVIALQTEQSPSVQPLTQRFLDACRVPNGFIVRIRYIASFQKVTATLCAPQWMRGAVDLGSMSAGGVFWKEHFARGGWNGEERGCLKRAVRCC